MLGLKYDDNPEEQVDTKEQLFSQKHFLVNGEKKDTDKKTKQELPRWIWIRNLRNNFLDSQALISSYNQSLEMNNKGSMQNEKEMNFLNI